MRLPRWLKRVLAATGVIVALLAIVAGLFYLRYMIVPSAPDFDAPTDQAEAWRQDLEYLRRYPDYDWSFDDAEKAAFFNVVEEVERDAAALAPAQFELGVARAVARAENAHTNVSPISRRGRVNALPLRFAWFDDGLYVILAHRGHADLLGARIESIAGHTPKALAEGFRPFFGGHAGRSRWISSLNMESPELLWAAGFSDDPERVEILLTLADGSSISRTVEAIPPFTDRAMRRYGGKLLEYQVPESAAGEWVHLMDGQTPPLYLSRPELPFFHTRVGHGDGLYIRLEMTMDTGGFSLTDFHQEVLNELDRKPIRYAVIDLRHNGGGTVDAGFSRALSERVPADGRIFIATSVETFSGGITEAAYLKHFGGDRAVVIGEPVGDHLVFWADGGDAIILPNSGIPVRVWKALEDWESGCDDWWLCFIPTMLTDVGVGSLEPDVPLPLSVSDYVDGRDPVMEYVLAASSPSTGQAPDRRE